MTSKLKADFHSHAGWASSLGKDLESKVYLYKGDPIKSLLKHVEVGNDVVALTTDDAQKSRRLIKMARTDPMHGHKFEKLTLLPCEEISTPQGELLSLYPEDSDPTPIGHSRYDVSDPSFLEKLDRARNCYGAALSMPHPLNNINAPWGMPCCIGNSIFDGDLNLREGNEDFLKLIDAIEQYNSFALMLSPYPMLRKRWIEACEKACVLSSKYNLAPLGVSDNHIPQLIGIAYTILEDGDPIKQMRNRATKPVLSSMAKYMNPRIIVSQFCYHLQNGELNHLKNVLFQHTQKADYNIK